MNNAACADAHTKGIKNTESARKKCTGDEKDLNTRNRETAKETEEKQGQKKETEWEDRQTSLPLCLSISLSHGHVYTFLLSVPTDITGST